jgi:branched-chain amino acid transport system substrate-binding protein
MRRGKKRWSWLLIAVVALLGAAVAGCGDDSSGGPEALPTSSCADIVFEGEGSPDYLIASDLPLQGASRRQWEQVTKAIQFTVEQNDFLAGDKKIGFQACDDATAQAGKWDAAKCAANGQAYAANPAVLGVVGTYNSGCAKIIVPILNRAPGGPLAMVSPGNTYLGLTKGGPGSEAGEPDKYYPTGTRNYARVVATDNFQGAADALLMKQLGLKNVYVLSDGEVFGQGITTLTQRAMEQPEVGVKVAGFAKWDGRASSYESLANKIKGTGADGVFLGGIIDNNGGKLVKDLRAVLGPDIAIIAPDGFTPVSAIADEGGAAAEGVYVSVAGAPTEELTGAGKEFIDAFGAEIGEELDPFSAYGAQATEVLLDAIERSDGTRQSVVDELFKTDVKDGILGSFSFDADGDTTANPVTFYRVVDGKSTTFTTITPPESLVKG